ncbi:MAG TPA: ATP-binding protein [Thermoanaerobaculia bacterium]|nr:ATP-binding protein [Thermoanaerobaculia bacterium]
MTQERSPAELRVLLLPLTARDGQASHQILASGGIHCEVFKELEDLRTELAVGAAVLVLPEEVVLADTAATLQQSLRLQPAWSDLPVIVLARAGRQSPEVERALSTLGNVSLVERPLRVSTLVSQVRSALRAREHQYQVRDLLTDERAARIEADVANRAKDRFLAVLSHELRTPLSPVVMGLAAMEADARLPPALLSDVSMMRRNIDLEVKLIDDLLDMSRVATGKLRLQREPVGVHAVLRHVFEICADDLGSKHLVLAVDLGAVNDRVAADAARLQQVFWNLLKNAVKFTPVDGTISVRTLTPGAGRLGIEIRDSGVGISADVLPKVFDAFEQGNLRASGQSGLGLGLAICKALVELHGGTIHAASAGDGQGACFTVELATARPEEAAEKASGAVTATPGGVRPRLLIVEDHEDTAMILARLLQSSGYEVTEAHTVAEALAATAAAPFDLLISDIGLPDASGLDLMRQIRARFGIPGIALSGYGMEEDIRHSRDAGFLDHIVKPINLDHLKAAIQRVIAR